MNKKNFLLLSLALIALAALGQRPVTSGLTPPVEVSNVAPYVWNSPHFSSFIPTGKSNEDNLFRQGLSRGKPHKGYFTLINAENKIIDVYKLQQYCKAHNYLYNDDYKKKSIKVFGSGAETVAEFYFLPRDLYIFYVFEWTDRQGVLVSSLKQKGSVYFYVPGDKSFIILNDALWSGNVVNGKIDGYGSGIFKKDDKNYYYFTGKYKEGIPQGKVTHRIVNIDAGMWGYTKEESRKMGKNGHGIDFYDIEIGNWNEGVATFRAPGNNKYGLVSVEGKYLGITLQPTYPEFLSSFQDGKIAVVKDKKESYINKTGEFVGYTAKQKKIDADKKAEEDRKKAEEERQRLLAEKKKAEEKRLAEEKEAAILRSIEPNKNPKLWSKGCRLAYRYPEGKNYIIATLEEWNEDRSKVKVKIVASPGARWELKGEVLEKNNTMWVSTKNEGWHLATDAEIEAALKKDNSVYVPQPTVVTKYVQPEDKSCPKCNGRGTVVCYNCDGKGNLGKYRDWETCRTCNGKGSYRCYDCNGTGRKR